MSSFVGTAVRFMERKVFPRLGGWFSTMGGIVLLIIIMIVVVDATGRRFFTHPLYGSYEAVSFLLGLLFFFCIVYCAIKKGHFVIDIVTSRLRPNVRRQVITILYLISTLLSWLLSWRLFIYALEQKAANATGLQFTFLPTYPFIMVTAVCSLILGFLFLMQTFSLWGNQRED